MSNMTQISVTSESHQAKNPAFAEEPKQSPTFTTLPPEIRLQIYGYVLGPTKRTLRRSTDVGPDTEIKIFNISLLTLSKEISAETLPLLYANQ